MTPPLDQYAAVVATMTATLAEVLKLSAPHEADYEGKLDDADEAAGEDGLDELEGDRIAGETGWVRFAGAVQDLADLCSDVQARHDVAAKHRAEAWVSRYG